MHTSLNPMRALIFGAMIAVIGYPRFAAAEPRTEFCERPRVEYLERFYSAFRSEHAARAAALLPQKLTVHMIGWRTDVVPFAGEYTGRQEYRDLFEAFFSAINFRDYRYEYELSDGAYTTWHFRLVGYVPLTGKTFDAEFVHVWQFDEHERPVFLRAYYDTQLLTDAFTFGGDKLLSDRKNPDDDYRVRPSRYDVKSLVASVYDRFYAGDVSGVFAMLSPNAAVYFQGRDNPQSGEYHGFPGLLQFIQNLAGTASPGEITRGYVAAGDRVDVILFENWTVYSTGKEYHVHTVNSWRVDDQGLLLGFINYPDIDAVAAAYVP